MLQTLDNPLQQQKCLLSLEGFQKLSCRVWIHGMEAIAASGECVNAPPPPFFPSI